ncbi:MAG: efflux transporter periplasmic adaptor subunit [Robiginitomaculum sp.]|nr:MAG: efflux transporter periplasmic adaptor subunit [Robiginitomaculum sp.]
MKKSHLAATIIATISILYFGLNALFARPASGPQDKGVRLEKSLAFKVVVRDITASQRPGVLILRGRSEAARTVSVRVETAGAVAEAPAQEGSQVKKGDVLCRLSVQARQANLDQARANRQARKLEWKAAKTLERKGHRSANQTASAKAAYDAAYASVRQAEIELSNINIRAPFDGVFERRNAEIGDYLTTGQSCGVVAELNPLIVVSNVSEQDVSKVRLGMPGSASLASGQSLTGTIRYVSPIADSMTRTFRIELKADNPDGYLRAGMTANLRLKRDPVLAQHIPTDTMVLDDNGVLGARVVDENRRVRFYPIQLIEDEGNGVWVTGLPDQARLIVEGQDFVSAGSQVDWVTEP